MVNDAKWVNEHFFPPGMGVQLPKKVPKPKKFRRNFRFFKTFGKNHQKSSNLISLIVQICRSRRELFYGVLNVSGDLLGVEIEPKHCSGPKKNV